MPSRLLTRNSGYYFIIKAAGDNLYEDGSVVRNVDGSRISHFVATNRGYESMEEAQKVARELAAKTPDNRYYVVKMLSGILTRAPQIEERTYE